MAKRPPLNNRINKEAMFKKIMPSASTRQKTPEKSPAAHSSLGDDLLDDFMDDLIDSSVNAFDDELLDQLPPQPRVFATPAAPTAPVPPPSTVAFPEISDMFDEDFADEGLSDTTPATQIATDESPLHDYPSLEQPMPQQPVQESNMPPQFMQQPMQQQPMPPQPMQEPNMPQQFMQQPMQQQPMPQQPMQESNMPPQFMQQPVQQQPMPPQPMQEPNMPPQFMQQPMQQQPMQESNMPPQFMPQQPMQQQPMPFQQGMPSYVPYPQNGMPFPSQAAPGIPWNFGQPGYAPVQGVPTQGYSTSPLMYSAMPQNYAGMESFPEPHQMNATVVADSASVVTDTVTIQENHYEAEPQSAPAPVPVVLEEETAPVSEDPPHTFQKEMDIPEIPILDDYDAFPPLAEANGEVVNVVERIVSAWLDEVIGRVRGCTCEVCRFDVAAYALNRLQPHYVVTDELTEESLSSRKWVEETVSMLYQAAFQVKEQPRHYSNSILF